MSQEPKYTHFKYFCRECKAEFLVKINQENPASTPHPSHCGRQRNCAFIDRVNQKEEK